MGKVHIIGAGVAGLAAAIELVSRGADVVVHEAAGGAGGRCRSWHDPLLEAEIDNGNHLMLSGNWATLGYLDRIGARDRLSGPERAIFPFLDLKSGERWTVDINRGPVPWWILDKDRRVRGTSLAEYIEGLRLLNAGNRTVSQLFRSQGPFFHRFWEPFTIAVLNTPPDQAAARLLLPVIRETLAQGAGKSTPLIARRSLADTLVAPALAMLDERGVDVRFGAKIRGLERASNRVTALVTARGREPVLAGDAVIAAVPAWAIGELVPEITAPSRICADREPAFPDRRDTAAADRAGAARVGRRHGPVAVRPRQSRLGHHQRRDGAGRGAEHRHCRASLARHRHRPRPAGSPMPKVRVIKEHRATFLASPEQNARRPKAGTPFANLVLAGEWIDTGLPTTIEGAIRSGQAAAAAFHG